MAAPCSNTVSSEIADIIQRLYDVEAVKFGDFTLKSGIQSPIYFDLRVMISYPQIMIDVANLLWEKIKTCSFQSFCGVPYTALPIATLMSAYHQVPMLIRRKEAKGYGTKKLIEGKFKDGDYCLIVEDVVSSGSSVSETVQTLNSAGIKVKDAVVLLNREQGGCEKLQAEDITLHSVFTMTDVLTVLKNTRKLEPAMVERVATYISANKFKPNEPVPSAIKPKELSFAERAEQSTNAVSRRLLTIIEEKKSNLSLSADVTNSTELLQLVEKTGPYVCMVKTHVDILEDFSKDVIDKLKKLAAKHNFLLFEDRKFADIGNTVVHQFSGGVYHISDWANIINAHTVPGSGVVQGLKKIGAPKGCGCLLIAEMSSAGTLASGDYTKATVQMAEDNADFVMGFICLGKVSSNPSFIHMTPGVQLQAGTDGLGQQYLTPEEVITNRGTDVIIVGRAIYQDPNPAQAAEQFQKAAYNAYLARVGN